jgi:hypothetical protein
MRFVGLILSIMILAGTGILLVQQGLTGQTLTVRATETSLPAVDTIGA